MATKRKPFKLQVRFNYDVEGIIARAKGGREPDQAAELLRHFCNAASGGTKIEPKVIDYLAECFARFLDGKESDIAKALNLKRQRAGNPGGVPTRSITTRLSPAALEELKPLIKERCDHGESDASIKKEFSEKFNTGQDTIRDWIRKYRRGEF